MWIFSYDMNVYHSWIRFCHLTPKTPEVVTNVELTFNRV